MDDEDAFRNALGLDTNFNEALARWRRGAPALARGQALNEEPAVSALRNRWAKDFLAAQDGGDEQPASVTEPLRVLSQWNAPPSKRDIKATLSRVRTARAAINTAINKLLEEERDGAWYGGIAPVSVPGIEDPVEDFVRPARAHHDPLPPLQVARTILDRYIENVEADLVPAAQGTPLLPTADDLLKPVLESSDISMPEAAAVMRSKRVDKSANAVTAGAKRLRDAGHRQPKRRRGNKRK